MRRITPWSWIDDNAGTAVKFYKAIPRNEETRHQNKKSARIKKLGGKICVGKTAVPEMGFFAICEDTEGNTFAIWERSEKTK